MSETKTDWVEEAVQLLAKQGHLEDGNPESWEYVAHIIRSHQPPTPQVSGDFKSWFESYPSEPGNNREELIANAAWNAATAHRDAETRRTIELAQTALRLSNSLMGDVGKQVGDFHFDAVVEAQEAIATLLKSFDKP